MNSCSGHGKCNNGVCTCNEGFFGPDCSKMTLKNGKMDSQGNLICNDVKYN